MTDVPASSRRSLPPTALAAGIVVVIGIMLLIVAESSTTMIVCPGCNLPQAVSIDHYAIQNNANQQPSLLTVWFKGYGRADQSLNLQKIYLKDITPDCTDTSLNPQTLPSDPNQHPFQVNGVLSDSSVIAVSVDTSTSNFYFSHSHCYELTLVTNTLDTAMTINYS